jgi:hypothetical protein
MAFGTTSIDPGSSPSVAVAQDTVAGGIYQRVKLADPTEGSASAIGNDANPQKVKPRRRGTADYDSGMSAVPNVSTAVTASTTYVERLIVTNISDAQRAFSLTNTAGDEVISQLPIAPHETRVFDLGGAELVGIKWLASAAAAVRAQIVGAQ